MASKKINCPNCKRLISESMEFCPFCSEKVKKKTTSTNFEETKKEPLIKESNDEKSYDETSIENFNVNDLEATEAEEVPAFTRMEQKPMPDFFPEEEEIIPELDNDFTSQESLEESLEENLSPPKKEIPKKLFKTTKKAESKEMEDRKSEDEESQKSPKYYENDSLPWDDVLKEKTSKEEKFINGIYNPNHDGMYDDTLPQIQHELENLRSGKERTILKIIFGIVTIIGIIIYLILTI